MKNAALWIFGLAAVSAGAWALDTEQFERMQSDAYFDSLREATAAYDRKDYDRAFALNHRAACAGDKTSQAIVGRMYLLGQGTPRNDLTGYAWIKLAAEFNFADFTSLARKLEGALSPDMREKGNALADSLRKLYGLAATNMSCHGVSRHGVYLIDSVVCTPGSGGGGELEVRRCADETAK